MFIHCKIIKILVKIIFVVAAPDFSSRDPVDIHLDFSK